MGCWEGLGVGLGCYTVGKGFGLSGRILGCLGCWAGAWAFEKGFGRLGRVMGCWKVDWMVWNKFGLSRKGLSRQEVGAVWKGRFGSYRRLNH